MQRQANVVKNIPIKPIKYAQPVHNTPISQYPTQQQQKPKPRPSNQTSTSKVYVFTEIENRPSHSLSAKSNISHPPLQTVYPAAIQNNIKSYVIHRPVLVDQYSSSPIPSSLPSIVHEPSNTVATIQNVPLSFTTYAQSYLSPPSLSAPVLPKLSPSSSSSSPTAAYTSTNSKILPHPNGNAREKVIVKVVKAPGWYLNDANERQSYFDAVAHGLLSENGLVYVNNIQKDNPANTVQALPSAAAAGRINSGPKTAYLPSLPQLPLQYQTSIEVQPFNFVHFFPCTPTTLTAATKHTQSQAQTRQLPFKKRRSTTSSDGSTADDLYSGPSSYNVGLQSVGRLAGDNLKYEYNLSSLRQQPAQRRQQHSLESESAKTT